MGKLFVHYFDAAPTDFPIYECKCCGVEVTTEKFILSKDFRGHSGVAFLVDNVKNVHFGEEETRFLLTGRHSVRNVHCNSCEEVLGWKYEVAFEEEQKYKEQKVVLELALLHQKHNDPESE